MADEQPETILYFCDESSQINDQYMAIGGLAVAKSRVEEIRAKIAHVNASCHVASEIKWSNAKARRVSAHKEYANLLFALIEAGHAHFHIRFAPFSRYAHSESGARGRVDTVSKMYYQMLLHRPVSLYGHKCLIHVHPDSGACTSYLPNMRGAICAAGYRTKKAQPNCIRLIEPRDSRNELMLQLLDVSLGALTALRNGRELGDVKSDLAQHVFSKTGWNDLEGNSTMREKRLNIWNAQPSK